MCKQLHVLYAAFTKRGNAEVYTCMQMWVETEGWESRS